MRWLISQEVNLGWSNCKERHSVEREHHSVRCRAFHERDWMEMARLSSSPVAQVWMLLIAWKRCQAIFVELSPFIQIADKHFHVRGPAGCNTLHDDQGKRGRGLSRNKGTFSFTSRFRQRESQSFTTHNRTDIKTSKQ